MRSSHNKDIFSEISSKDAEIFLNYLSIKHAENNSARILEYSVDSTGSDGLVAGESSFTWINFSNERENRLCYCLQDDDGLFELEHFNVSTDGLFECLECLFYQQSEVLIEVFIKNLQDLLSEHSSGT